MTFQSHHETHADGEVLRLTGHVGFGPRDLIEASSGAPLASSELPLVLDLTDLQGWGKQGRAAVVDAVRRLAALRPVTVRGPRDRLTLWALTEAGLAELVL